MLIEKKKNNPYFEKTLLPLLKKIEPTNIQSSIAKNLGIANMPSCQSFFIKTGNVLENFWNTFIDDNPNLENINYGKIQNKQIDHLFKANNQNLIYYFESKCNINFDTEKTRASNEKIQTVQKALKEINPANEIVGGYFIPILKNVSELPDDQLAKCKQLHNKNIKVYFVDDLLALGNNWEGAFKSEEFFDFFQTKGKEIFAEKVALSQLKFLKEFTNQNE